MALTEDQVREALKQVVDPELFINVVDLGLVYAVEISDVEGRSNVRIDMTMTSPACPEAPELLRQAKVVVGRLEGAGQVEVKLVLSPPWSPDRMSEEARDELGLF
ncbi:MAG: metal-sulfur cluster assembly factor [Pirellulales bacterium]